LRAALSAEFRDWQSRKAQSFDCCCEKRKSKPTIGEEVKTVTQPFNIHVDDMTDDRHLPESEHTYRIALAPSSQQCGSMGTRSFFSEEQLATDMLARLNYSPAALGRFFAGERQDVLVNFPLSEEDAAYFGWLPEYDRRR
jgi:hypothetical protein